MMGSSFGAFLAGSTGALASWAEPRVADAVASWCSTLVSLAAPWALLALRLRRPRRPREAEEASGSSSAVRAGEAAFGAETGEASCSGAGAAPRCENASASRSRLMAGLAACGSSWCSTNGKATSSPPKRSTGVDLASWTAASLLAASRAEVPASPLPASLLAAVPAVGLASGSCRPAARASSSAR